MKRILLTELSAALAAKGYEAVSYNALRRAILGGEVPATKDRQGRWTVAESDLTRIAKALGCERLQSSAAA